jgi:hypothetical protein
MSLSSVRRIASAMFWPCETRTSTCRNPRRSLQACIASSALPSLHVKRHSSGRTASKAGGSGGKRQLTPLVIRSSPERLEASFRK